MDKEIRDFKLYLLGERGYGKCPDCKRWDNSAIVKACGCQNMRIDQTEEENDYHNKLISLGRILVDM